MRTKAKMKIDLIATKRKLSKEINELSENPEKKDETGNFYVNMVCGLRKEKTKKSIKQHIIDFFKIKRKSNETLNCQFKIK